jgi:hypothetical protein
MTDDVIDLQPHRARRANVNLGAYVDADMYHECPNCGVAPNAWCTRADGHVRRTPCIKRIRPSVGVATFGDRAASPLYVTKG